MSQDTIEKLGELKAIEERQRSPVGVPARLLELSEDSAAEVRGPAIGLAGRHPEDADLVRRALELSENDPDPDVRLQALECLAQVVAAGVLAGAAEADYAPQTELGEPDAELYAEARARLLTALDGEPSARAAALVGLAPLAARSARVRQAIDAGLEDGELFAAALLAAGSSGCGVRWGDAIVAALADEDPQVARAAAAAAGLAEVSAAGDALAGLLFESEHAAVRAAAAASLGRLRGRAAIGPLLRVGERDGDSSVREAARVALADLALLEPQGGDA